MKVQKYRVTEKYLYPCKKCSKTVPVLCWKWKVVQQVPYICLPDFCNVIRTSFGGTSNTYCDSKYILYNLLGPFAKFVYSPYYSESELYGSAVTVSFSKYLPW
jgi:hypothetical protein